MSGTDAAARLLLERGLSLQKAGVLHEAIKLYEETLTKTPTDVNALYLLATARLQIGMPDRAIVHLEEALKLGQDSQQIRNALGVSYKKVGKSTQAKGQFERSIALESNNPEAHFNLGNLLSESGQYQSAVAKYQRALSLRPNYEGAITNLGLAFLALHQYANAKALYETALKNNPNSTDHLVNLAITYERMNQRSLATEVYRSALNLEPDNSIILLNLGHLATEDRDYEEAFNWYRNALYTSSNPANAYRFLSLLQLRLKRFSEGFEGYLRRWDSEDFPSVRLRGSIPQCEPGRMHGRILVWAEQGLGDEIFYAGLFSFLSSDLAQFTISADSRLHPILKRSFPNLKILDHSVIVETPPTVSDFDFQAPVGNIGYLLGLQEPEIRRTRAPYLQVDALRKAAILELNPLLHGRVLCGLSWRSKNKSFGREKSLDLLDLEPLLRIPGITFVNLQYGDVESELIELEERLGIRVQKATGVDLFNDIDGLLSLIDLCDFVVTSSNVTAHLAGSIGKPSAVMLPYGRGRIWYWHDDDEESLWYPSLRLFSQTPDRAWTTAIKDTTQWIKRTLNDRPNKDGCRIRSA